MNIQNIKAEIHRLPFEEGMTLQEIAKKYGKIIYWVNARLNKNYEPRRLRHTSDDIGVLEDLNVSDEVLADEIFHIRELREQGLTYEEIASNLNRSVYWAILAYKENTRRKVQEQKSNFRKNVSSHI